jgi:hypothetical protein
MEEEGARGGVGQYAHDVQPLSRGLNAVKVVTLFYGRSPLWLQTKNLRKIK